MLLDLFTGALDVLAKTMGRVAPEEGGRDSEQSRDQDGPLEHHKHSIHS